MQLPNMPLREGTHRHDDRPRCVLARRSVSPGSVAAHKPMITRWVRVTPSGVVCGGIGLCAACTGTQSALDPAGVDAERIAMLWWWMLGCGAAIWLAMTLISVYAMNAHRDEPRIRELETARWFIVGGGVVFPTLTLTLLLIYGLSLMPPLLKLGGTSAERIEVIGEQWWWRVRYHRPDGSTIETANELNLAVGERVTIIAKATDVIHSFWIPSLAGKIDMIPGRTNFLGIEPTRTGTFRGACAEFCGASHAWMALHAVVVSPDTHHDWLEAQSRPARVAESAVERNGAEQFDTLGCGSCHTIRGSAADGTIGPDLTHVGSRVALGAAIMENELEDFERWIDHPDELKPEVNMPAYDMISPAERHALAVYLESLE